MNLKKISQTLCEKNFKLCEKNQVQVLEQGIFCLKSIPGIEQTFILCTHPNSYYPGSNYRRVRFIECYPDERPNGALDWGPKPC